MREIVAPNPPKQPKQPKDAPAPDDARWEQGTQEGWPGGTNA